MAVTILGDNTVSVAVVDSNAISVDVGQVQQTGVDAYGGIGPTIVVSGTHTAFIGTLGINPFVAGPNITITQSAGNIIVSGVTPPTVLGDGDGDLVTLADDVQHLDARINAVVNALPGAGATQGIPLVVVNSGGAIRTASSYVASVNGRTGSVSLSLTNLTTSANTISVTHDVQTQFLKTDQLRLSRHLNIFSEDGVVIEYLNEEGTGLIGQVARINEDAVALQMPLVFGTDPVRDTTRGNLGAAAISHTHTTTSITGFTASIKSFANVVSVSGRTGAVTLGQSDIASRFGNDDLYGDLVEFQNETGAVAAKFPAAVVPAGRVLTSSNDGPNGAFQIKAATGFVHSIAGCTGTVTLVAGGGVTITPNVALNRITIASTGGGGSGPVASAIWPALILGG
jgi:hypothetical protein